MTNITCRDLRGNDQGKLLVCAPDGVLAAMNGEATTPPHAERKSATVHSRGKRLGRARRLARDF